MEALPASFATADSTTNNYNMSSIAQAKHPGMFGPGSDIHDAIRQLFDLSPDYILLADMDCVHRRKGKLANLQGHLYIFNKCLAFHS